jgi:hypothetical protein
MTRETCVHALVFLHTGRVAIQDRFGNTLWKSDAQPQTPHEELGAFLSPDESAEVLEWLVEHNVISDEDADEISIESEALSDDDDGNEDDDGPEADDTVEWE